ncbi:hypothetical protein CURE108131_20320 [Cupriavidus respiraculi]|uniref:DUF5666 domain-containing protein n=2 Tax=Cupriavidus respiraculi TaxID=195930 RepID=A0ABN7Z171_9BURK|nr:hypothetical protein LMG21510_03564 [Cupriavidus respiraculi]
MDPDTRMADTATAGGGVRAAMAATAAMAVMAVMAVALAGAAQAQPDTRMDVQRTPGKTTMTGTATVKATIARIDAPTRTVTLKTHTGRVVDLKVGEEARNFDQLRVGDMVTVEYREALAMSLEKGSGPLSVQTRPIEERSAPGARPGGMIGQEVTVVADVVAVSPSKHAVTLKGPGGNVVDLLVDDPSQLASVKKGDRVKAVYTEAIAVAVQPAAK